MKVSSMVVGAFGTNTYILSEGNDVILIDPAFKPEKLDDFLADKNLLAILLTHGHFDHIKGCDGLHNKYHCPVYIFKEDEMMARDKTQATSFGLPYSPVITCPLKYLHDGKMNIGPFSFEVMQTKGHSEGSCCFIFDDCIFTGDTLFCNSVGRTDLEGGSDTKLKASLREIKKLDPNLIVYPGHDSFTVLKNEFEHNPYLNF